jgi:beta-alanine--pyruvate transaminase
MTMAKGLTSAHVPMGGVVCRDSIYETFMKGPEHVIELFHGYTYSGHPVAAAAGVAALEAYQEEGIFERVRALEPHFEDALHACRELPGVKDIRNFGLMGAIEMEPWPGQPGKRGFESMIECYERGVMTRIAADTFEFSPPLIAEQSHLDRIFETVSDVIRAKASPR